MEVPMTAADEDTIRLLAERARPLGGHYPDYDPLLDAIGDARVVLLGESSHGTHDFYHERARITRRLIEERGFTAVAVEADWPDAYRVNRFVRGAGEDASASEALSGFERFPTWMWRNTDVLDFVDWLRDYNSARPAGSPAAGFYGLDLYSMFTSMHEVVRYLDEVDPEAAGRARYRYGCFDHFGEDSQAYGYAAEVGASRSCEDQAVQQLEDLRRRAADLASRNGRIPEDEFFYAEQNARLVLNAEEYYRSMFGRRISSWNLRDQHMAETLDSLIEHFDAKGKAPTRVVVWAHNTHVGDARATEMGEQGELNVGQLARERWGEAAFNVGFTTYSGSVTAATGWDAPAERKTVLPGLPRGFEALFHETGIDRFLLRIRGDRQVAEALRETRLERAIGVIYRPETERISHYFDARLADQFDAIAHVDRSRAVRPLEAGHLWHPGNEAPETFPSGL
jgi:erythromycin esterase-like protein